MCTQLKTSIETFHDNEDNVEHDQCSRQVITLRGSIELQTHLGVDVQGHDKALVDQVENGENYLANGDLATLSQPC